MWIHLKNLHVIFRRPTVNVSSRFRVFLATGKGRGRTSVLGSLAQRWLNVRCNLWMMQAWFPPQWALIGRTAPVFRFGVFEWARQILGWRSRCNRWSMVMAPCANRRRNRVRDACSWLGNWMLAKSRPYEGFLLSSRCGHHGSVGKKKFFVFAPPPAARTAAFAGRTTSHLAPTLCFAGLLGAITGYTSIE